MRVLLMGLRSLRCCAPQTGRCVGGKVAGLRRACTATGCDTHHHNTYTSALLAAQATKRKLLSRAPAMQAEYAKDFAANFAGTSWVKVPHIYTDLLREEVIVMEYVPGVKINNGRAIDEMGLDRARLARLSVESYLQQLLRHGLFHADPHPGNVAVDAVGGGRLIYYDFGMMGRIQPRVRCARPPAA
jgi:RIO-like serine/threonine protein kinase